MRARARARVCVCERETDRELRVFVFVVVVFFSHTCYHLLSLRLQVTYFDKMNITKVKINLDHLNE